MNIETILSRPSVRGLEFRLGIEAYAHKVGSALGLSRVRVLWRHDVQTAGINDYGDLYLAGVTDEAKVSRALVAKYAAYVVHELLHHKYTDFGVKSPEQYIRTLHNAVEDGWIENTGIQSGLLGNIGPLLGEMIDTMTKEALETVKDWNDPRQYPYVLAVHCRKHATIKCPTNPALTAIFDFAAQKCLSATSSTDTLKIAEWVYEQIKKASKDKPKGDGKKEGKDKKGAEKPSDGPTSPDQPEGEGEGADKADKPSNAPSGPVKSPEGVEAKPVEPKLSEGGLMGNYSSDISVRGERYHVSGSPIGDLVNAPIPARLRYEVKRLFDDSGLSDFTRNRKAGVVNVHALPTVAAGNDRVFKRRLEVEGVDSAVVICLDVSGSMFDTNSYRPKPLIGPAVQTCRALLETLDAAGVKTAVLCFGSQISVPKGFNKSARQASAMLGTVNSGGGTSDYAALRYAHQLLAQRHERRKITFVITDGRGQPDAVRQQVTSGNALGVTTIGIGIKSDVSDIYGQAVTVRDIEDLGNASFKQIKLAA
jgi:Mg-chelatase subunit ChlD